MYESEIKLIFFYPAIPIGKTTVIGLAKKLHQKPLHNSEVVVFVPLLFINVYLLLTDIGDSFINLLYSEYVHNITDYIMLQCAVKWLFSELVVLTYLTIKMKVQ